MVVEEQEEAAASELVVAAAVVLAVALTPSALLHLLVLCMILRLLPNLRQMTANSTLFMCV